MSPNKKRDKFSDLPVSKQRRWQLRKSAKGRCIICGEKRVMGKLCLKHKVAERERDRVYKGCKSRYTECHSYKLEAKQNKKASASGTERKVVSVRSRKQPTARSRASLK